MRFIALAQTVERCRPEPPLTKLHNDCGAQDRCARRLAANTVGAKQRDFSKAAMPYGSTVLCRSFLEVEGGAP